jgi:BON domain
MRSGSLTVALALLGIFLPIAAQQPRPAAAHQRATPPVSTAPARPTDAQIDAAIRTKLAKSKIGADKFHFKVQGGVATIEGKTDVIQHKGAATRMAHTAGAIGVNNHIEISEAAKEKASDNLAKGRRRAQIKRGEARSASRSTNAPAATGASAPARKTTAGSAVQKQ